MSQQIIEVLEYLFEKFGIAVDWTASNIMPYVQQLAKKIVTYNIVSDSLCVFIGIVGLISGCIYVRVLYKSYAAAKTSNKNTLLFKSGIDFEGDSYLYMADAGFAISVLFGGIAFFGIIFVGVFGGDLMKWIFIPELQLVEYISDLVNNVQM